MIFKRDKKMWEPKEEVRRGLRGEWQKRLKVWIEEVRMSRKIQKGNADGSKGKLGVGKRHKGKIRREEIKGINTIAEK